LELHGLCSGQRIHRGGDVDADGFREHHWSNKLQLRHDDNRITIENTEIPQLSAES
jgi:hypothetical protein